MPGWHVLVVSNLDTAAPVGVPHDSVERRLDLGRLPEVVNSSTLPLLLLLLSPLLRFAYLPREMQVTPE